MIRLVLALVVLTALLLPAPPVNAQVCRRVTPNAQGSSNASVTVDGTAGGVSVLAANATRCSAVIINSGSNPMRCAPTTVTVSSTVGTLVAAGAAISLGSESQQAWKCIRTGSSTTADTLEGVQ